MTIGKTVLRTVHFPPAWAQNTQARLSNISYEKSGSGSVEIKGDLGTSGIRLEQVVTPLSHDSFRCEYTASAEKPAITQRLALEFEITASTESILIDGRRTLLPPVYTRGTPAVPDTDCGTLAVLLPDGSELVFSGKLKIRVINERRVKRHIFTVLLYFTPDNGEVNPFSDGKLAFTLQLDPMRTSPVSLSPAANMGFADEVAGDGRGGWTDQGPENDLRMMKPGTLRAGGAGFLIPGPAENGGKAIILLGKGFSQRAEVPASAGGNRLFLLHASAWHTPGLHGNIIVAYADGSKETLPVVHGRDITNWHMPGELENGLTAYRQDTGEKTVGLYCSQFPPAPERSGETLLRAYERQAAMADRRGVARGTAR